MDHVVGDAAVGHFMAQTSGAEIDDGWVGSGDVALTGQGGGGDCGVA